MKTFIAARDIEKGEILTEDDLYYNNTLTDDEKKIEWLSDILNTYFYNSKIIKTKESDVFEITISKQESINFEPLLLISRYYGVKIRCFYRNRYNDNYIFYVEVKR